MLRLSLRRPRTVLALWLGAVAGLAIIGVGVDQRLHRTNVTVEGTPSARAQALAQRYFGDSQALVIMLTGPRHAIDRQARLLAARIQRRRGIAVLGPWAPSASATLRPRTGRTLLLVRADDDFEHVSRFVVPAVRAEMRRTIRPPLAAHLSGYADIANGLNSASIESLRRAELIAGPLVLLILLAVFRSPLAAAFPLLLGLMTIGAAAGALDLVNRLTPIDAVGLNMASMFGLALAVDYSLLIVSRFREELASGAEVHGAAHAAIRTAGRTVLFAGVALGAAMIAAAVIAPGTLLLSGGIGTITAVVISVIGATSALPALLVVAGSHLDRWQIGRPPRGATRWGNAVASAVRRPLPVAVVILALLLGLAAPGLAVNVGVPDPRELPTSRPERRDFDAIAKALPGGWMAPYDIIVASRRGAVTSVRDLRLLDRWQQRLASQPGVRAVLGPAPIYDQAREARRAWADLRSELTGGQRGLERLSTGLTQVDRGVDGIRSGLAQASDGASRLAEGGATASAAAPELKRGLETARSGSQHLLLALVEARDGAALLADSAAQAHSGADRLARALRSSAGRTDSGIVEVQHLAARMRSGSGELQRLREPVQTSEDALRRARARLDRMLPTSKLDPAYASVYEEVLRALSALSGRNAATGRPVHADYRGLDAELARASADASAAADAIAQLAAETEQLGTGLDRLGSGAQELAAGLARLAAGNQRLLGALGGLEHGGGDLAEALAALDDGGLELGDGVETLRAGAHRLASDLETGFVTSGTLADGVARARAGTDRVHVRAGALANSSSRVDTRIFDSAYLTLAGLDASRPTDRTASTFAVNLDRGGSATRLMVIDGGDPTVADNPLRARLEADAQRLSRQSGLRIAVGGPAAQLQDFHKAAARKLWLLILVLVVVTYVVLVPILRSLVLPLLAVGLNVLTVGAAFGVLTLLFQGAAPLGGPGKLDAIMVRAILSIVFALSIDYAVFLLARIREGYARTGTTEEAIEYGLRHTASVITGAALIMIGVFVAFALSPVTSMRQLGVGLTVAVLLDATLVRLLLLPAAIRLAGRANWWLPAPLERYLPRIDLDPVQVVQGGPGSVRP